MGGGETPPTGSAIDSDDWSRFRVETVGSKNKTKQFAPEIE